MWLQRRTVGVHIDRSLCCRGRKQTTSPFEAGCQHDWWVPSSSQSNLTPTSLDLFISGRTGEERKGKSLDQCSRDKNLKKNKIRKEGRPPFITLSINWSFIIRFVTEQGMQACILGEQGMLLWGHHANLHEWGTILKAINTDRETVINYVHCYCFVLHLHWF